MPNLLTQQFPKISRIINERDLVSIVLATLVILFAIFIVSASIVESITEKKELEEKREVLIRQKTHWAEIVRKYPDYRDGFLNLSIIEYKLGNKQSAKDYVEAALRIDSNSETGKKIADFLREN